MYKWFWYVIVPGWQESFRSSRVRPVMALYQLWHSCEKRLMWRHMLIPIFMYIIQDVCYVCQYSMLFDVIVASWQETFRSTARRLAGDFWVSASRLAADLKVSCQPAGRRHFKKVIYTSSIHQVNLRSLTDSTLYVPKPNPEIYQKTLAYSGP